ncbi:MAG: bifunctional folylpolyglutamate synthase/dihydrofolate synthase [bacterium]|nr:bifunctional folylpolyglutamate synthase/dihydrofolate synthase [bacterium]
MKGRTPGWDDFFSLQRFGMTATLDNIRAFCDRLNHPQRKFSCVHVAGTNGKGSVVATLSSILQASGLKTGMYTSPHILKFNERIKINNRDIEDDAAFRFLDEHWDYITERQCTFFEVATAMALDFFRLQNVNIAVVEVGLGGTFDATRIVDAILTIVTRIDYDHMDRLGNTLTSIAADKAGIFRKSVPVLVSSQHPDVLPVLREKADAQGAPFYRSEDLLRWDTLEMTPKGIAGTAVFDNSSLQLQIKQFHFPLTGSFQIDNLRTALAAGGLLAQQYRSIDSDSICTGLNSVHWPGRLQVLQENPTVILDVGHNTGAIRAALDDIKHIWQPGMIKVIFSALRDKDIKGIMTIFRDEGLDGYATPLATPRGLNVEEIRELVQSSGWKATILDSVAEAMERAVSTCGAKDLILVIGSHYLAEEILKNRN